MKNVIAFCIVTFSTIMLVQAEPAFRTTRGNIITTQHGSMGFSASSLSVDFPSLYGQSSIAGGQITLLSGHRGVLVKGRANYAALHTEYRLPKLFTAGLNASILDTELDFLRIAVNGITMQERQKNVPFFHVGGMLGILPAKMQYTADWYWGQTSFSLHDFGSFIAQPACDFSALVQKLSFTHWYECTVAWITLNGTLRNKEAVSIASGTGHIIEIKNTVHIPASPHTAVSVSAAYLYFYTHAMVHLTAQNQEYFFFPYLFYNRTMTLNGSLTALGSAYHYTKNRLSLRGAVLWYAVLNSSSSDVLQSKEKKITFF